MLDASSHLLELDSSQAMWRLRSATTQAFGVAGGKVDLQTQPIGPRPKGKRAGRGNSPQFDLRTELYRITGIDWAQVNGIDVLTAQTVIAEAGDLQAFASEKHFTSWLGLCPTNETSGGKVLNRRTRKAVNRAATAFRNAASTLFYSTGSSSMGSSTLLRATHITKHGIATSKSVLSSRKRKSLGCK